MSDSIFINLFLILVETIDKDLKESRLYNIVQVFFAWFLRDIKKSRFVSLKWKDEKSSFYMRYSIVSQYIQDKLHKLCTFF